MSSKIIISPDSIHKIQYPLIKFDFIWIDEGVSFMYYLGNHLFVDTKFKSEIMIIIEWLLQNCKKLLITDADLNNHIIQFYLYFRNISYTNYFIYKKQSYNYKYEIIDLESDILESLKNHIISHQNLYICCDTLIKTKFIYDFIINYKLLILIKFYFIIVNQINYMIKKCMMLIHFGINFKLLLSHLKLYLVLTLI